MNHAPIELGSILFTMVEPHRGHEVAYNRWYERDHFYAGCMLGPGILAGRRFAATRREKDLRYPPGSTITPDLGRGSYLALYWISKAESEEWGAWAVKQVNALHAAGRMFAAREHVHTQMYRYAWGAFRDPDGVPAELALDHPYAGVAAVIGEGITPGALDDWYRNEHLPRALEGSAAAMCLSFSPIPLAAEAPADVPRRDADPRRFLHLYFLDRDPSEVWDAEFAKHGDEVAATGGGEILFASPFIPTIPGTDTYTDRLW